MEQIKKQDRIARLPELCSRTGYSRSMVFEKINPYSVYYDALFPRRIPLGARAIGFLESEIDAWIQSRSANCTTLAMGQ